MQGGIPQSRCSDIEEFVANTITSNMCNIKSYDDLVIGPVSVTDMSLCGMKLKLVKYFGAFRYNIQAFEDMHIPKLICSLIGSVFIIN